MDKKIRARKILVRIKKHYTLSGPFVTWRTPLELVVGTVLSAQCTDVRVNLVTKKLFKKYTTARDYARAKLPTLEKEIYSTGFYKSKARYLKGIGEILEKNLPDACRTHWSSCSCCPVCPIRRHISFLPKY